MQTENKFQARNKFVIKDFIEKSQFDSSLFEYKSQRQQFTIYVKNTELRFAIIQSGNSFSSFEVHQTKYSPGYPLKGPIPPNRNFTLDQVLQQLQSWLNTCVRPYLEELRLTEEWNEFENFGSWGKNNEPRTIDTSPLTSQEIEHIDRAAEEIKQRIINELIPKIDNNFRPLEEKIDFVNQSLEYLKQASIRQNKFDFTGTALHVVISIGINCGVDTDTGKLLLEIFKEAFDKLPLLLDVVTDLLPIIIG